MADTEIYRRLIDEINGYATASNRYLTHGSVDGYSDGYVTPGEASDIIDEFDKMLWAFGDRLGELVDAVEDGDRYEAEYNRECLGFNLYQCENYAKKWFTRNAYRDLKEDIFDPMRRQLPFKRYAVPQSRRIRSARYDFHPDYYSDDLEDGSIGAYDYGRDISSPSAPLGSPKGRPLEKGLGSDGGRKLARKWADVIDGYIREWRDILEPQSERYESGKGFELIHDESVKHLESLRELLMDFASSENTPNNNISHWLDDMDREWDALFRFLRKLCTKGFTRMIYNDLLKPLQADLHIAKRQKNIKVSYDRSQNLRHWRRA